MGHEDVLDRYYRAMRRGAEAEESLVGLFADDAVYDEPFSGEPPAVGIRAIRCRLRQGWATPLPDLQLDVLEVEISGSEARSLWECRSPGLPGPIRGEDRYHIRDGRISRLQVRLLDEPEDGQTGGPGGPEPSR